MKALVFISATSLLFFYASLAVPSAQLNEPDVPSSQTTDPNTVSQQSEAIAEQSIELPYKYIGNSFSGKFHRPSCPFARAMSARHVCLFHFRFEAIEAGQVPCRYCLPPNWRTVKAIILPRKESKTDDALPASKP